MTRLSSLLLGEECPECGEKITAGSLRYEGHSWTHKSGETHPQAGHHAFDAAAVLGAEGFVPTEVREHNGQTYVIAEAVLEE